MAQVAVSRVNRKSTMDSGLPDRNTANWVKTFPAGKGAANRFTPEPTMRSPVSDSTDWLSRWMVCRKNVCRLPIELTVPTQDAIRPAPPEVKPGADTGGAMNIWLSEGLMPVMTVVIEPLAKFDPPLVTMSRMV